MDEIKSGKGLMEQLDKRNMVFYTGVAGIQAFNDAINKHLLYAEVKWRKECIEKRLKHGLENKEISRRIFNGFNVIMQSEDQASWSIVEAYLDEHKIEQPAEDLKYMLGTKGNSPTIEDIEKAFKEITDESNI